MSNLFTLPPLPQQKPEIIDSGAQFSPDKIHRYVLWRMWDMEKPSIMFIGLNPSRADQTNNDRTIDKCIQFSIRFGYGRLHFANLFSFRTPYVKRDKQFMAHLQKPGEKFEPLVENLAKAVGEEYNFHLVPRIKDAAKIVCCWGSFSFIDQRSKELLALINQCGKQPWCFGVNADGQPKHPLYLKNETNLQLYATN